MISLVSSAREGLVGEPWRWIGMWTYLFGDPLLDDSVALGALIKSDAYSDSYLAAAQESQIGDQRVHGPYATDRLDSAMFEPISSADAWRMIYDHVCNGSYQRSIESVSFSGYLRKIVSRASKVYKLRSEVTAFHGLHWMTGDFTDLAIFDRSQQQLVNVVMGYS